MDSFIHDWVVQRISIALITKGIKRPIIPFALELEELCFLEAARLSELPRETIATSTTKQFMANKELVKHYFIVVEAFLYNLKYESVFNDQKWMESVNKASGRNKANFVNSAIFFHHYRGTIPWLQVCLMHDLLSKYKEGNTIAAITTSDNEAPKTVDVDLVQVPPNLIFQFPSPQVPSTISDFLRSQGVSVKELESFSDTLGSPNGVKLSELIPDFLAPLQSILPDAINSLKPQKASSFTLPSATVSTSLSKDRVEGDDDFVSSAEVVISGVSDSQKAKSQLKGRKPSAPAGIAALKGLEGKLSSISANFPILPAQLTPGAPSIPFMPSLPGLHQSSSFYSRPDVSVESGMDSLLESGGLTTDDLKGFMDENAEGDEMEDDYDESMEEDDEGLNSNDLN